MAGLAARIRTKMQMTWRARWLIQPHYGAGRFLDERRCGNWGYAESTCPRACEYVRLDTYFPDEDDRTRGSVRGRGSAFVLQRHREGRERDGIRRVLETERGPSLRIGVHQAQARGPRLRDGP